MSIVIPNMEMPKACLYCRFHEMWNCILCNKDCLIDGNIAYKERMDFCPLVELPPHGDLIERDKLPHYETFSIIGRKVDVVDLEDIKKTPVIIEASEEEGEANGKV